MRMWMADPAIMCRQHLLGEHVEIHMFLGTINRRPVVNMAGYLDNNLFEPASLHDRHAALVAEMELRGYNHISPLGTAMWWPRVRPDTVVDKEAALKDLLSRCPECALRAAELGRLL